MQTGLDRLINESKIQNKIEGNIGILCHSASVTSSLELGIIPLKKIFKKRIKKLFGPQHGLITDVQDNMVESRDFLHPYFKLPVHSLYSNARIPTDEMLDGLQTIIVDLQDVGTRIYTYIYTLTLLMEKCAQKDIKIVVLDRPNPIGGDLVEGNILDPKFTSFVGRHPLPVRHGLTIGEVALMAKKFWGQDLVNSDLEVIPMKGWKRWMSFEDTNLPWILPSPNLATVEAAYTFVGTVLFEGTNISEGRGTTRSLEIIGHPKIEPFSLHEKIKPLLKKYRLEGFILRPLYFMPTFQKWAQKSCGGFQIHVTDRLKFRPWRLAQFLCKIFYHELGPDFAWKQPPYEYEYDKMPVDLINGTDQLRLWVEKKGKFQYLDEIERPGMKDYLEKRSEILLYH